MKRDKYGMYKIIRILAVMALSVVLAGSSFYYSLDSKRNVVRANSEDMEIADNTAEEEKEDIREEPEEEKDDSGENSDTEILIAQETEEPEWSEIEYFERGTCKEEGTYKTAYLLEGLACVCREGKYGYMNKARETAIPFTYDDAGPFMEGLAYFSQNGKYGFMDQTGEPKFYLDCDSVSQFVEGLAYFCIDGRYGYIDTNGETVIEPIYDDVEYFKDGTAEVVKDSKRGIIDKTGHEVVPIEYIEIKRVKSGGFLAKKEQAYDVFDMEGNLLSRQEFTWAHNRVYGWGELGNKEKEISGFFYEEKLYRFEEYYVIEKVIPEKRLVIVYFDGEAGVIDFEGEVKIPFSYKDISYNSAGNVFILQDTEEKWGVLDGEDLTTWRLPCSKDYDSISSLHFETAMLMVEKGDKYGAISPDGEILIPIAFDWMEARDRIKESDYYGDEGNVAAETNDVKKMSDCLFGNHITPRASVFLDFLQNGSFEVEDKASSSGFHTVQCASFIGDYMICKFYDFTHTGKPVLYLYTSPYDSEEAYTGFFSKEGEEVKCMCSAFRCGGRIAGPYVCLWYDREEGQILYGKDGAYVFNTREHDSCAIVYDYEEDFEQIISINWRVYWDGSGYYFIDGEQVSWEEHSAVKERFEERYEYISYKTENYP